MRFQMYSQRGLFGRRWYWRLRAANNEIIAQGEGYRNRADCLHAIDLVKGTGSWTQVEVLG